VTNPPPKKLLDQVRDAMRLKHYSLRTEDTYVEWIKRYILFYHKRHPKDMGAPEIEAFLTHLAVEEKVAASTQNQAFSAILFLYRYVLQIELPDSIEAVRMLTGVATEYGKDSPEYEAAGGVRKSERKKPVRTLKTA
jgi:site-specific recombinase XerD